MGVSDQNRRAYQLLTAREQYIGEYTPEVSELETRLYDIQAAGALDTEGLEELAQIHTRLAEIQRPLTTEGGIDTEIRNILGTGYPNKYSGYRPKDLYSLVSGWAKTARYRLRAWCACDWGFLGVARYA